MPAKTFRERVEALTDELVREVDAAVECKPPLYAYGDNEAACQMSGTIDDLRNAVRETTDAILALCEDGGTPDAWGVYSLDGVGPYGVFESEVEAQEHAADMSRRRPGLAFRAASLYRHPEGARPDAPDAGIRKMTNDHMATLASWLIGGDGRSVRFSDNRFRAREMGREIAEPHLRGLVTRLHGHGGMPMNARALEVDCPRCKGRGSIDAKRTRTICAARTDRGDGWLVRCKCVVMEGSQFCLQHASPEPTK